jgi:putative transposase
MADSFFTSLNPGSVFTLGNRKLKSIELIGVDRVLAYDMETGKTECVTVDEIQIRVLDSDREADPRIDLDAIAEEDWQEARRRLAAITALLDYPKRTRAQAEEIAKTNGVHVATIYVWLRTYEEAHLLSSLLPQKRGRRTGTRLLPEKTEVIIDSSAKKKYRVPERNRMASIIEDVQRACKQANIPAPHPNTIRSRLAEIPAAPLLRDRGQQDLAHTLYEPIKGHFPGADFPLAVVQIDHSPANIIVVDEDNREPLSRPWITLAICVFTRMIVGLYISLFRPSAQAVGLALRRAILPKKDYLKSVGVQGDWPVWGLMQTVHADNAREFRCQMVTTACEEYSIDLHWRPLKTPHYGAHIERLMGTVATDTANLPGKTFENVIARSGYNPSKEAIFTLKEFETDFVDFVVNKYHIRKHSSLGTAPLTYWSDAVLGNNGMRACGLPDIPRNPERLALDFTPMERRSIQPYGVRLDDIHYYHEVLNRWIGIPNPHSNDGKFIFRRDPDRCRELHFWDPETKLYHAIPTRDLSRPNITLSEINFARRALKKAREPIDEDRIFAFAERREQRIEEAKEKTRQAKQGRRPNQKPTSKSEKPPQIELSKSPSQQKPDTDLDDLFSTPVEPF